MQRSPALASLELTGYARRRKEVWPVERRGASAMSPYVRYGLVDLPTLWAQAGAAPASAASFTAWRKAAERAGVMPG